MEISAHISELLFEHDCVILPGLGGFVCSEVAASINHSTHTFYPPHKNIIFNKNLLNNDGLLAHKIAADQSVSYIEANTALTEFIEKCKSNLQNLRRLELINVGVLFLDKEDNIQFIQDKNINYSFSAFGLSPFKFKSLEQQHFSDPTQSEKQPEHKKVFVDREPIAQTKKTKSFKKYAPALALIPIAALMLWLPFKMKQSDAQLNVAGWSLTNNKAVVEKTTPITSQSIMAENEKSVESESLNETSADTVNKMFVAEKTIVTQIDSTKVKTADYSAIQLHSKFHVMAGCFAERSNAEKLVEDLRAMGFSGAGIVGETNSGLIRVAYSSHAYREDAVLAMNKVKGITDNVWILNK